MQRSMINIDAELGWARNMFGAHIGEEYRQNIQAYINNPTPDGWDEIHGYIILPTGRITTVWQCVLQVDPTFPRSGRSTNLRGDTLNEWERIPDADLIRQALAYATH